MIATARMGEFTGKRALVTGAGAGIGLGIAKKLAEMGAEVYAVSRTKANLESLQKDHPSIKIIPLDITDWDKTRKAVKDLAPIHLLVNNAGVSSTYSALEATEQDFDRIFNLNVKAVANISQTVAKGLIGKKNKGTIVNVSSVASHRAVNQRIFYCPSKAAVDMLTKCFALELGPYNIRVNTVNPFIVMTELGKRVWSDEEKAKKMKSRVPQGRFVEVDEVVNAVVFLLSDQSEMVNGHALPVDGGFLAG